MFLVTLLVALTVTVGCRLLRKRFISNASNCITFNLEFDRVAAGSLNISSGPLISLHVVAVEEVAYFDVSIFGSLNLLPEKLIFGEILVREVVLNLGLYFSVVGHPNLFL